MRFIGQWLAIVVLLSAALGARPAQAIEVSCLEASRYKYLMRIFGNDPARFAAFFRSNVSQAPHPEACRALIVTGPVMRFERGRGNEDFRKLAQAIADGRGWVSTLYLASPGGNIGTGLRLGELTRLFWLNTYAVEDGNFDYVPDFLGGAGPGSAAKVPPELQAGYADYQAATQAFSQLASEDRRSRRCASACTFVHAAGVYRSGAAYFHRGRRGGDAGKGGGGNSETSMSDLADHFHDLEARLTAYYRKMDAGEAAVTAYQSTATETTASVTLPMMPRYVGDYLKKECARSTREPAESVSPGDEKRAAKRAFPEGFADVQCIAASNSRERLNQFAKLCPGGCDTSALFRETGKRLNALVPQERSSNEGRRRQSRDEAPRASRGRPYRTDDAPRR